MNDWGSDIIAEPTAKQNWNPTLWFPADFNPEQDMNAAAHAAHAAHAASAYL